MQRMDQWLRGRRRSDEEGACARKEDLNCVHKGNLSQMNDEQKRQRTQLVKKS